MQALPNEGAANLYEAWRKPGLSFLHRPERPEQAEARRNLGRLSPRLREVVAVQVPVGEVELRSLDVYELAAVGGAR